MKLSMVVVYDLYNKFNFNTKMNSAYLGHRSEVIVKVGHTDKTRSIFEALNNGFLPTILAPSYVFKRKISQNDH